MLRRVFFDLGYTCHGGSGLGYSLDVVLEMPLAEIFEFTRLLDEQRTDEAKKIKAAHKQR